MLDRFNQMRVFIAVAEEESFAAAARQLQMSPPAVTRAIASLELQLGVKLFNRTTRYVRVTEAGLRYLEDVRRILADLEAAEEAAAGVNSVPRGRLTVTAPVLFGRMFVMPGIVEYLQQYPDMKINALLLDRVVNLMEEGVDVGVRIGELEDSNMQARKVGSVRLVLVASAEYIKKNGLPQEPKDLHEHTTIASTAGHNTAVWRFQYPNGSHHIKVRPRLSVTTNDAVIDAAKAGFGITRVLSYQVAPQLADGSLKLLLQEFEPPAQPVHIIHREGRLSSSKVRAFIDVMINRLQADKALN